MAKHFRPWDPKQKWLLPPEITEFIPEGHACHLVRDLVVEHLDLAATRLNGSIAASFRQGHAAEAISLSAFNPSPG